MSARSGMSFLKFLIMVVLLASVVVIGWGIYANRGQDHDGDGEPDGFTLQLTNPDWWQVARGSARDLVEKTRPYVDQMKEKVWGDGGLVDDAKAWLEQGDSGAEGESTATAATTDGGGGADEPATPTRREPPATEVAEADTPATAGSENATTGSQRPTHLVKPVGGVREVEGAPDVQTAAVLAPRLRRLESRFANIEERFAEGIEFYEQANPARHGWTDETVRNVAQARERFVEVREDLEAWQSDYGALPEHDPERLARSQRLSQLNQKLLYNATKMSTSM
ncbi:MAG: hypothetical protein ACOCYP_04775 [Planctomycetota bacterium]